MLQFNSDETPVVKVLTAGDEIALEQKINEYIQENSDKVLADLSVQQTEYHSRLGSVEFGYLTVIVMKAKKQ